MKKYFIVSLLLSLSLVLGVAIVVRAKVPSGYGHTRGLYLLFDVPEYELNPPQVPLVGGHWRYKWSELEPGNATYNWGKIDNWILKEQERGKLVAIGFTFFGHYGNVAAGDGLQIPSWLPSIDPNVRWQNPRRLPEVWYVPNYWNQTFRNYYQRFINAFAQHLAENPALRNRVAWVSMGVGVDGETYPAPKYGAELDRLDHYYYLYDRGITVDQWVEYVNWCSSMYKQAFQNYGLSIPIFIDIGPTYRGGDTERNTVSAYAASLGIGMRHNGLVADHDNAVNAYAPINNYWNTVPVAWETYATTYLSTKSDVFWALMCGLSKRADNIAIDKKLWLKEENQPLLRFAARYLGVTVSDTPGAWVALRETKYAGGDKGNFSLFLTQKDDALYGGKTVAVWDIGQSRGYLFDVPNGSYQVKLHFAEIYANIPNARVFDIKIENVVVRSNLDIWTAAGGKNRALVLTFSTTVSDGRLEIDFVQKTDMEPVINAIEVIGPGYTRRINCGGLRYTDSVGNVWVGDQEYEPGSFGYIGGGPWSWEDDILNTDDDYLYQTLRIVYTGAPTFGRFTRRTDQSTGNRYMRFDIDNGYMYPGNFSTATITVTYLLTGTDRWELRYDALGDSNKAAIPVGSTNPWVQKDNSGVWTQAVFFLTDARFANGQPGGTDFSIDCLGDGDEYISFVEVTKDGGSGPTITPTPTTIPCTLQGKVTLQGRPTPPNVRWVTPLTVTVGSTEYAVTTDTSGYFTVTGLTPGTYDIRVKHAHTLRNVKRGVTLVAGQNNIDFGTLLEGDANNNNCVDMLDFVILRSKFGSTTDLRADFNQDGVVDMLDFVRLRANFGRCGDIEV
nr:carboxypeptidase regulatory-like domain-containing protein [Chloroflexota bacterium]